MAVAHDGAQLARRVVGVACAVPFVVAAVVDGASRPTTPMGMIGAAIVSHFVGNDVEVPSVGVDVVRSGAGEVSANPCIETVAEAIEVGDSAGANVGPHGKEVLQVQWNGVEVGVVVPFGVERAQEASAIVDHRSIRVG